MRNHRNIIRVSFLLLLPLTLLALFVLATGVLLLAEQNKFGVADVRQITFSEPTRIAGTLLPKGEYEVRHTMQGENHIMVFKLLGKKKAVEAQVKCSLQPLKEKAEQTQTVYQLNAANERVLQQLIFRGDTAAHVF